MFKMFVLFIYSHLCSTSFIDILYTMMKFMLTAQKRERLTHHCPSAFARERTCKI